MLKPDEIMTHTLRDGRTRTFTAQAELATFVREIAALARASPPADPEVLTELVYGALNPLVDGTDPDLPKVTAQAIEHPAFEVLLDLVEVARENGSPLEAGLRAAALVAACTMPISDAAARLGVSEHDVLGAIAARRVVAVDADGIRCDPRSVEAYALWLKRVGALNCPIELAWGDAAGRSFRAKFPSGMRPTGTRRGTLERWERVALLLSESKADGRKELTLYELAPAPDGPEAEKRLGAFFARGRFRIERIERNPKIAREDFARFAAS